MPIDRSAYQDTLRMRFDFGQDPETERQITRTRSYTRVKHTVDDEVVMDLADAFEKLFDPDRINVYRVMHVELRREE